MRDQMTIAREAELNAPTRIESSVLFGCPFCNEQDFDATGLKIHLTAGHCEAFNNTSIAVPRTMNRSGMHDPIRYYRCPKCEREFVAPPEGYAGLCNGCKQPNNVLYNTPAKT